MKKRTTRRALVMSLLSLLLCCSMLVGTTFAWFTDSVTSGMNKIIAGNLDVELTHTSASVTTAEAVQGKTDLFVDENGDKILWEPGVVVWENLTVSNEGTLALKYQLSVNFADQNAVKGTGAKLSEALKVAVVDPIAADATREDVLTLAGEGTALAGFAENGQLLPKGITIPNAPQEAVVGAKTYGIVIWWEPSAEDNRWNIQNGAETTDGEALQIDLGINLVATQLAAEDDSFDNTYDQNAGWLGDADTSWYDETLTEYVIDTAEELAGVAALSAEANKYFQGKTIKLGADINLEGAAWTPIGVFKGTFDGNGHTISNLYATGDKGVGLISYALNGGNVKNLTVENAFVSGTDYVGVIMGHGYTDIDNCHVKNATVISVPALTDEGIYDGGAKAGGVIGQLLEGEGNTVTNCSATNVTVYAFRDLGGVVGMVHNKNSCSGNTASNITLGYILCDQITADKNENAGAIYGRVSTSATVLPEKDSDANRAYTLIYAVEGATAASSLTGFIEDDIAAAKTIVLLSDVTGDVTVSTKENTKVVIDGNGKNFVGGILVDGKSATYANAALTIKDLTFNAKTISSDACIRLGADKDANTRYTTNVTISGCTFAVPGAVGIKSYTGGDKNLTVTGCTAAAGTHSLLQIDGVDGVRVEGCFLYSKNGINTNQSNNVSIVGCTADVTGYAVRFGASSGSTGIAESYEIKDCTLKSACDDGDAVVILRGTAADATLTIENTTLEGTTRITNNTNATVIEK